MFFKSSKYHIRLTQNSNQDTFERCPDSNPEQIRDSRGSVAAFSLIVIIWIQILHEKNIIDLLRREKISEIIRSYQYGV